MINRRGFTLVELIVVIVVIAILATLATLGFNRYLEDGRDNRRTANATTIAEALEKYYDKNGEYPSCAAITAAGSIVSTNTLKGIDQSALLVPNADSSITNSIKCGSNLTPGGTTNDFIQYVGDGSADCTGSGSCLNYTLRYRSEGNNTVAEITSRRTANIATSGAIKNLAAAPNCFTGINLTWSSIANTTGYTLQRATDAGFTANLTTTSPATNSSAVTGLVPDTDYYFRVKPEGTSQSGAWSNVATTSTLHLGTPSISATVNSTSQITTNWTASTNAGCGGSSTTYTVQRATNSAFSTGLVSFAGQTGTSYVHTGLTVGQTYYFRVQGVTTADTSNWSNTVARSTVPNAPTNVSATVNSATQVTVSWTASSGATSYTIRYGTNSSANSYSTTTTGTSVAVGGLSQGTTWYFQVFAVSGGVESAGSTVVNGTTPINAPGAYNMNGSTDGTWVNGSSPAGCPGGTSAEYHWSANGGGWVQGTQYQTVGYYLNPGQGVTIQVATRCFKNGIYSAWTWSNNSYGYTRPGMNLWMGLGDDGCSYGFCGRVVNAGWNNMCGTGAPTIYAHQYSAYTSWGADSATGDSIRWKGASGAGVWVYYDNINIGCTSASGAIQVPSAYKCDGCS